MHRERKTPLHRSPRILVPLIKTGLFFCTAYFLSIGLASATLRDTSKEAISKDLVRLDARPPSEFSTTGFFEGTFYPPHNEYPANFGLPFRDEPTARYALAADVTVEHVRSGLFAGLYLFMPMGDSKPATSYTYNASPIFLAVQPTLGYHITGPFELRLTYNKDFDLGKFASKNEVTPWLSLSLRASTQKPIDLWNAADLSGFAEASCFAPGLEYPATPGASPKGYPIMDFSRAQIVNARYALGFSIRLQPKQKYLDHLFFYADPELFFGNATLDDHWRFGGKPLSAYLEWGIGLNLASNLELRFYHAEFDSLGGAPGGLLNLMGNGLSLRYLW